MSNDYTNAPRGATSDATDLDELERVVAGATAGKWTAARLVHHERGDDMTPAEVAAYVEATVAKSAGDSGSLQFFAVLCEKPDGPADVCHVGNGPTSPANALAIEALHNAWPSLLAELRALRAVRDAVERYGIGLLAMDESPDDVEPDAAICSAAVGASLGLDALARSLAAPEVPRG